MDFHIHTSFFISPFLTASNIFDCQQDFVSKTLISLIEKHSAMALIDSTQDIYSVLYTTLHCSTKCAFWTAIWIPIYVYRWLLARYVENFKSSFGEMLDPFDSALEENYSETKPRGTLVFSFVLEGAIELHHLRNLFVHNVLQAKISDTKDNNDHLRYPELQQYQVDVGGYRFWKDDLSFNIANHISERMYNRDSNFLAKVHQELANKLFPKERSPWEVILIKNYEDNEDRNVLFCRSHHSLGDTKSILKMFVEGLGQKQLSQPKVEYVNTSLLDQIAYYVLLPFYVVYVQVQGKFIAQRAKDCPWKYTGSDEEDTNSLNVGISKKVSLSEVKSIAKRNNVTTSAVIMAAIAGGIEKCESRLAGKAVACKWVLPKVNHPDILANHNYSASIDIPTDITSISERLKKCNEIVLDMKTSNMHKYAKCMAIQMATWINPWRKRFVKNDSHPLLVTNIAGGSEEFVIGSSSRCSELTMSCGPLRGARGLLICAFSYMDKMDITVTARESILDENQTQKLATLIEMEFSHLNTIT